jgi:(2R)-3-sulfolactate dehydrogenase (NADP+)
VIAAAATVVDGPGGAGTTVVLVDVVVVEVLVTALIGANFGFEASSFFVDEGNRPGIGQAFLVVDPGALAGREAFFDRLEVLVAAMLADEGVRLPGARREALREAALRDGIDVPAAVLAALAV